MNNKYKLEMNKEISKKNKKVDKLITEGMHPVIALSFGHLSMRGNYTLLAKEAFKVIPIGL